MCAPLPWPRCAGSLGRVQIAGLYGFRHHTTLTWKALFQFVSLLKRFFPHTPRSLVLPTRELGLLLRATQLLSNGWIGRVSPIQPYLAKSTEAEILTEYLQWSFEGATLGVMQDITALSEGSPFCDEQGRDYLARFAELELPLLVICADRGTRWAGAVRYAEALICQPQTTWSMSRTACSVLRVLRQRTRRRSSLPRTTTRARCARLAFSDTPAAIAQWTPYHSTQMRQLAFGHCDILIGSLAVNHVWEKLRIWLDERKKLQVQVREPPHIVLTDVDEEASPYVDDEALARKMKRSASLPSFVTLAM